MSSIFPQQHQQAAIQAYDTNQLAPQFAGWNFNLGEPYDKNTPVMCLYTINEIQNQAQRTNHPIRIGFFDVMSENHFNNKLFEDLMFVIVHRVGHGITNNEWRDFTQATMKTIEVTVKACASSMAAADPDFMATLKEEDRRAAMVNVDIWNYLMALADGKANWVSFDQMGTANSLSPVSTTTQSALEAARGLRNQNSTAYAENYSPVTSSQHNNNGGQRVGRYGRRAEIMHGKLEGGMQTALKNSGAGTPATPYQSRLRKGMQSNVTENASTKSFSSSSAKKFDTDITNFSETLLGDNVVTNIEPVVERLPTLFEVPMGSQKLEIVRERSSDGYSSWKPTTIQPFHPAWCTRTHRVRYFETREGQVIAVLQTLTDEEKEIAMNYESHAIDPTKGKPAPSVPVKPVREAAKVLYAKADSVTINVVVSQAYSMEEGASGAIRSTRLKAETQEKQPEAYAQMSAINTPIIYANEEEATEDLETITAISSSKDFASAAAYLSLVKDDLARKHLNTCLVDAVNNAIENQLGVGVRISDFIEDGPVIVQALGDAKGMIFADKLGEHQAAIIKANVKVVSATDSPAYASATLSPDSDEPLGEDFLKRVVFLQKNVCVCWVKFTNNELAIGMPPKGAAPIQPESLGGIYKVAEAVFKDAIGSMTSAEQYLITKDGVQYNLHRGLLLPNCYLLSKKA